jgi:hypothetical protein
MGGVGFLPSYYHVKAILVILDIILRLFIRGLGYSNFMLCIYTVPHGGVIVLSRFCLSCSANIYLNRTYLELNLTPNFAHTRINSYNKAHAKYTKDKVHKLHIKNKIKFWYAKKQNLNKILYQLHIKNGKQWGNL